MRGWFETLGRDLESPIAVRRFGSGWFAGFFALLFAIAGLCSVTSLRWPSWFSMPELAPLYAWSGAVSLMQTALHTLHFAL
jgi:hypothetical protein